MRVTVSDEQIRAAFEGARKDTTFEESRALFEMGQRPAEMIQAMCLRPEILRAFGQSGCCVYPGGLLERTIKEYVIIEASRRNACQFCRDSHVAVARMLGLTDEPLKTIQTPEALTERERLAIEYTGAAMEDSNRVSDELFGRLKANFTEPEIVELTALIGFINMLNLFNNCLRVTYNDEYVGISERARGPMLRRQA